MPGAHSTCIMVRLNIIINLFIFIERLHHQISGQSSGIRKRPLAVCAGAPSHQWPISNTGISQMRSKGQRLRRQTSLPLKHSLPRDEDPGGRGQDYQGCPLLARDPLHPPHSQSFFGVKEVVSRTVSPKKIWKTPQGYL